MGSGIDLGKLIPSVLFSFFILAAFTIGYFEMGAELGVTTTLSNSTFDFANTLNASRQIEKLVDENTTNPGLISSFFPGIPLMMNLVTIIKSTTTGVFKDIVGVMDKFFTLLGEHGAGGDLLNTLKLILISTIAISIAFIILAALFRQGGFKEK